MDRNIVETSIRAAARFEFSRSGGPGGQNVNKVNSRATARINFTDIQGLSLREKEQALARLAGRLTTEGEILVSADDERDQARNREISIARLVLLVIRAATIPRTRVPTSPTRASRERRLESKRRQSGLKRTRGAGDTE